MEPAFVAMWDADLSTPLDEVLCFLEVSDKQREYLPGNGIKSQALR